MDREIRELEKAGEWQRLYASLNRSGRDDEARELFLDHPITVDCTIQYRYDIHWSAPDWINDHRRRIKCYTLNELIEEFVVEKVGASQIISITRNPVYRVMGGEIDTSYFTRGPLKSIAFTIEQLEGAKARIRSHPYYMQGATAEQLEAAAAADNHDASRAQRRIQAEREEFERQRAKLERINNFERDARQLKDETWNLWAEFSGLERVHFACAIKDFSMKFILFKLKDALDDVGHLDLDLTALSIHRDTATYFNQLWTNSYQKRFGIWKKSMRN